MKFFSFIFLLVLGLNAQTTATLTVAEFNAQCIETKNPAHKETSLRLLYNKLNALVTFGVDKPDAERIRFGYENEGAALTNEELTIMKTDLESLIAATVAEWGMQDFYGTLSDRTVALRRFD